jgi:carbamate kinase
MRIVAAIGGNALQRVGDSLSVPEQRKNVRLAVSALAEIARGNDLIVTHGNGPQVGLLAEQASRADSSLEVPLDVLDAETEGMIGYFIEQEFLAQLPVGRLCASLLTQVEVSPDDPAFHDPTKPIGPVYGPTELAKAWDKGWTMAARGGGFRRLVPSPLPLRLLELDVIRMLVERSVIVICGGGGGIPVVRGVANSYVGVEAVVDKDATSALLAEKLDADALLLLTDVEGVYTNWGRKEARLIRRASPDALAGFKFATGSMAPKVAAARHFVGKTGKVAAIGRLQDAARILRGEAGTVVSLGKDAVEWYASDRLQDLPTPQEILDKAP